MTIAPVAIAAQTTVLKQNVTLSLIKQSNDQAQALVGILDQAADAVAVSGSRGTSVNISV